MPMKMGGETIPDDHPMAKAIRDTLGEPPTAEEVKAQLEREEQEDGGSVSSEADKDGFVSATDLLKGDPTDIGTVLEEAKQAAELTYEDRLTAQGISMAEARELVDAIITKGVYHRIYPITSDYSVTFKTRTAGDNEASLRKLERETFGYAASISNHHTLHNLAYSLHSIGSNEKKKRIFFNPEKPDATIKYLHALPTQYFVFLVDLLIKFENLIRTVLEDGAIQNF